MSHSNVSRARVVFSSLNCDEPETRGDPLPDVSARDWRNLPVVRYSEARKYIQDGDALIYLPRYSWRSPCAFVENFLVWLIGVSTGKTAARMTHVAMAGWWGDNLMRIQMAWGLDRVRRLSEEVKEWPGSIVVGRPVKCTTVSIRARVVSCMIDVCQRGYGWLNLFRDAIYRHTHVRWLCKRSKAYERVISKVLPPPGDVHKKNPYPFCSAAYSHAWRSGARFDICPDLADCETEPRDLFLSNRMVLVCRLVP